MIPHCGFVKSKYFLISPLIPLYQIMYFVSLECFYLYQDLFFFFLTKIGSILLNFPLWTQKKWILLLLNGVLYKCQLLLIVFFFSLSVWYHIFYSLSVWLFSYISFWKGILKFLIVFVYLPISPFSSEFLLHLFSSFVLRCLNS